MADFNAYPALQIKSPELGPGLDLPNLFKSAEEIQGLRNRNALFPIEQEALQQQNQLGALSLQHAKQADEYGKISSALQTIGLADNPKDQEAQWNQLMGTFPEGKQWIGKFDANKLKQATQIYGGLAQQSASIARGAATAAAATRQRAGAGAAGGEDDGTGPSPVGGFDWEGVNVMEPGKKQATLHGISKMVADVDDLARTPADQIQAKWDEYARKDGFESFGAGTQFSPQGLQRLMEFADDAKPHLAALGISAATGVQIKRPDVKQIANQPFEPDTRKFLPLPMTANQIQEAADKAADRASRERIAAANRDAKGTSDDANTQMAVEDWAQRIHDNKAKIENAPAKIKTLVNSRLREIESGDPKTAVGITGTPEVDITTDGYTSKPIPQAGDVTQAVIDNGAIILGTTERFPGGLGIGNSGAVGLQKKAMQNRSGELFPGGIPAERKATIAALSKTLGTQVGQATTMEASVKKADAGFKHLVDKFEEKGINDENLTFANIITNAVKYRLSNEDINAFRAGLQEVANEYGPVFQRGGQLTDAVRASAKDVLPGEVSMKALRAIHQELQEQGTILTNGTWQAARDTQERFNGVLHGVPLGPAYPTPPPDAIKDLKAKPETALDFEEAFGPGSAVKYLGAK